VSRNGGAICGAASQKSLVVPKGMNITLPRTESVTVSARGLLSDCRKLFGAASAFLSRVCSEVETQGGTVASALTIDSPGSGHYTFDKG